MSLIWTMIYRKRKGFPRLYRKSDRDRSDMDSDIDIDTSEGLSWQAHRF
jgi:hypothetical protein